MNRHLAQVNIARMLAPISDPVMAGLAARVDEMNALAETSPGFIWRLRSEYVSSQDLEVFRTYVAEFDASRLFLWDVTHLGNVGAGSEFSPAEVRRATDCP